MRMISSILSAIIIFATGTAWAKTTSPASGRRLSRGHWLSCDSNGISLIRSPDPKLTPQTPPGEPTSPSLKGSYSFDVLDTWEEWVTHSGSSCSHCGESCSGSGKDRSCSCNSCSWQELETFTRPWSTQKVTVAMQWEGDEHYQNIRKVQKGNNAKNLTLTQRMTFDPDRPASFYLFPGEFERFSISQGHWFLSHATEIDPTISPADVRHDYVIDQTNNGRRGSLTCDDVDVDIRATIKALKRIVTTSPNSIEFRKDWVDSPRNKQGHVTEQPYKFKLVDIGAFVYEGQNIHDNYKDTKVWIRLRQIDRFWWFDRFVSDEVQVNDNTSIAALHTPNEPPYAIFEIPGQDLMKTPLTDKEFGLNPGKTYEICSKVFRGKNIYYKQKEGMIFKSDAWSEMKCANFVYDETAHDMRGGGRKFRDGFLRWLPFSWW